jgi:hypothetical protein
MSRRILSMGPRALASGYRMMCRSKGRRDCSCTCRVNRRMGAMKLAISCVEPTGITLRSAMLFNKTSTSAAVIENAR